MSEWKIIRIPALTYLVMRDAIRAAERDSRNEDRALHDDTRDLLRKANDAITDYQDNRAVGVRR